MDRLEKARVTKAHDMINGTNSPSCNGDPHRPPEQVLKILRLKLRWLLGFAEAIDSVPLLREVTDFGKFLNQLEKEIVERSELS